MSIIMTATRYEFIHGDYRYLATRNINDSQQFSEQWHLLRWPVNGPTIPPVMETLYTTGWQHSMSMTTDDDYKTFPHIHGVEDFVDPLTS